MRPEIVLFGDSITQQSFRSGGWGAALADNYSRKADVVLRGYAGYNTRWALFLLNHIFPLERQSEILLFRDLNSYLFGPKRSRIWRDCGPETGIEILKQRDPEFGIPATDTLTHGNGTPPVAVTIFFGANDAALLGATAERQHVPVEEYKENLRKIVTHIKNCSPNALILLITPPPVDPHGRREYARSLYGDKASPLADRTSEEAGKYAEQCVTLAKELNLPSVNLWSKMQETEDWQKKYLSDGLHLTPEGNAVVFEEVIKVFEEANISALPYDFPDHTEIDTDNPETAFVQQCGIGD